MRRLRQESPYDGDQWQEHPTDPRDATHRSTPHGWYTPRVASILLIGTNGQLGSDLRRVLVGSRLIALTHRELEVTDARAVERAVAEAA